MKLKIISDGTSAGTKLIDEDTGEMIHLIQNLTWQQSGEDYASKVTIELINIPVEIVAKAEVELLEYDSAWELKPTKTFEKEIKISSKITENVFTPDTRVYDNENNTLVGAVQEVKWQADTTETKAQVKRIKFDNKDW